MLGQSTQHPFEHEGTIGEGVLMDKLTPGDRFPEIAADAVDGSTFRIPDDLNGVVSVLLFYRGHW